MWTTGNRHRYDRSQLRYPSDLTDEEWLHVEPLIPPAKRGGSTRRVITVQVPAPDPMKTWLPVAEAERDKQVEAWGIAVSNDRDNGERLCGEADGALSGNPPRAMFVPLFVRRGLDTLFLAAIREALAGPPGAAFERLLGSVKAFKVEMRRHLEQERQAEATRWLGDITDDPFYDEIKHLITPPAPTS